VARRWFRAEDGTYYRNSGCVEADIRELERTRFVLRRRKKLRALNDEWKRLFWHEIARKPALEPGDIEVKAVPMRLAYPNHPGLWTLDEGRTNA
jgi:hypothetical protein